MMAALLVDQVKRNGWDEPKPEAPPMRDLIRAKSGEKVGQYFLEPVPPGHPMEPAPKKFSIDGDIAYVREAEYPALLEVLARNRAKDQP